MATLLSIRCTPLPPFRRRFTRHLRRRFASASASASASAATAIGDASAVTSSFSGDSSGDVARCKESFARRMASSGVRPHHRIALGVSGGPDSMALCVLAAEWKLAGLGYTRAEPSEFIDGMLAIVVDHGLRPESAEESQTVRDRVMKMGIKCEVVKCEWFHGRPKLGHLQEAARDMRYRSLTEICMKQQFGILLIAHHSDDQAELFVLRLSRNSGILGLAGMPFISCLFPSPVKYHADNFSSHGILLVRPLLELSKWDMYKICETSFQPWVEDPTNNSMLFVRNRIRASLGSLSMKGSFQMELQRLISACRLTRAYVDAICSELIKRSLTISNHGYGIIDLEKLNPVSVDDLCLTQYLTHILQFFSQRHKPLRGRSAQLLLDYIRTTPCKNSLTVAGCYLSALPQSKGKKLSVACSTELLHQYNTESCFVLVRPTWLKNMLYEPSEIMAEAMENSQKIVQKCTSIPLLHVRSSRDVLQAAKDLKLISDLVAESLSDLQKDEYDKFHGSKEAEEGKPGKELYEKTEDPDFPVFTIKPGQGILFMKRYLISWRETKTFVDNTLPKDTNCHAANCKVFQEQNLCLRCMVDSDWLYLAKVSSGQEAPETLLVKHRLLSAKHALKALKLIPVSARRSLPVLTTTDGVVASVPSIGFSCCPCLEVTANFFPTVPLGGGHAVYV